MNTLIDTGIDQSIDYHRFVDEGLAKMGLRIELITEEVMRKDIREFSTFINDAFTEYYEIYKWRKHADDDYLLNPLTDKFKYSFCIRNLRDEIVFVDFSSVTDGMIDNHIVFTLKEYRGMNLAKYHIIKLSQVGLDNGYTKQIGYFSKKNKGSISLFVRMGYEISHIREDGLIIAYGDSETVLKNTYKMLTESDNSPNY